MRILLVSDVHANICAMRAIERTERWDEVWCCGDLVDFGPFPVEVIHWMREHNARCVLGNHDAHVLAIRREDCQRAYDVKQWQWTHQNLEQLAEQELNYLHELPRTLCLEADGICYQMQHQFDDGYGTVESLNQFRAFWKGGEDHPIKRLLFGHTHRRGMHMLDENSHWLNPGSASYRRPDDPDKRAHYMMLEDGKVRFGAINYDRSLLLAKTAEYLREGRMLSTHLQDAFFFFGNAATTRSPLPMGDAYLNGGDHHDTSAGY